jgi:DNA polymerase-3 subunit delta
MKLNSSQLGKQLQGPLAAVYAVSGDDPLLCQEASDAIRAASRTQGFSERQVLHVDKNFDWGLLYQAGASLSLFAEKRLIELRIDSGKPGDQGGAALIDYLQRPAEDTLLLISLPKLDGSTQKTKWAKTLIDSPHSQFVQIWPVEVSQLPGWIRQRLSQAGLNASAEAIELIAARVEGNLLAAAQEIEKLKLGTSTATITAENVLDSVGDSARFDVFGLIDAALGGDAVHALRMLEGLRGEGEEPLFILAILARELRLLAALAIQVQQGVALERAFASARPPVWDKRRPLLQKALQRLTRTDTGAMLQQAQQIDAQVKGQAPGNPWSSLTRLLLQLAGTPLKLTEPHS